MTNEPTSPPDDSRVEVLPVPESSIVWVHNIDLGDEQPIGEGLARMLENRIGHDRFLVLITAGSGVVSVVGEDEIVARVRAALAATNVVGMGSAPTCTFCEATIEWVDLDVPHPPYTLALQRNVPCGHIVERTDG